MLILIKKMSHKNFHNKDFYDKDTPVIFQGYIYFLDVEYFAIHFLFFLQLGVGIFFFFFCVLSQPPPVLIRPICQLNLQNGNN